MEISQTEIDSIVSKSLTKFLAELQNSTKIRPDSEKRIRVDLSVDRTLAFLPFGIPMRAIQVVKQSDSAVAFEVIAESVEDHKVLNAVPLGVNDGFDYGRQIARWYVKNAPQAGKWVEILVSVDGTFKSGKQVSLNSGGVLVSEGSSSALRTTTGLDFAAGAAGVLLPADLLRVGEVVENRSGISGFVGDANCTGATGLYPGQSFSHGDTLVWKNTSALYFFNPGAAVTAANFVRFVER